VDPAPLSELHELLHSGDLAAARELLARTAWTNLANVLRALPEEERRTAFGLLHPGAATRLRARLTDQEQRDLGWSDRAGDLRPEVSS
jgi:Mg/Co/Ni transporter MgtE